MTNPPPIPPNCPYFVTDEDRPGMLWFHCKNFKISNYEVAECLTIESDELQIIRPVVAAVARCAWLDEAYRVRRGRCLDTLVGVGQIGEYKTAKENASAWRVWGLQ